jgi:putative sterol carrier protein
MPTPSEIFTEMGGRLSQDPSKIQGMDATYQFDLTGDDGGQWFAKVADGSGNIEQGTAESPNITITMAAADFVDLATGKLDGTMAFMSGKLKIKGDMGLAMKLQNILR